ncbi:MAG: hypothetical protein M0R73_00305 [Dehalococcoidia bacterium]|nr:hypothetical protein [Dehalococcoidia bacterium]
MRIGCGWAEFVDPTREDVVARGSVFADAPPNVLDTPWDGEVRLIRGHQALIERGTSVWILRFEEGQVHRIIELQGVDAHWAPSGLRGTAQVSSYDELAPAAANELGGE